MEERRHTDPITLQLLETIKADVSILKNTVHQHIVEEKQDVQIDSDRRIFIDMLIAREEKRNALKDAIIEKTFTGLVWFIVLFLIAASWEHFKLSLGIKQ